MKMYALAVRGQKSIGDAKDGGVCRQLAHARRLAEDLAHAGVSLAGRFCFQLKRPMIAMSSCLATKPETKKEGSPRQ